MSASMSKNAKAFTLIELLIVIAIIAILALIAIPNFIQAQTRAKVSRVKADMRSLATAIEAYMVDHNNYPIFNQTGAGAYPCDYKYNPGTYGEILAKHTRNFSPGYMDALTTPVAYFGASMPTDPFGIQALKNRGGTTGWWDVSYWFFNFLGEYKAHQEIGDDGWEACRGRRSYNLQSLEAPQLARFNLGDGDNRPTSEEAAAAPSYHINWMLYSPGPDLSTMTPSGDKNFPHCISTNTGLADLIWGVWHFYDPTNGVTSRGEIVRFDGMSAGE